MSTGLSPPCRSSSSCLHVCAVLLRQVLPTSAAVFAPFFFSDCTTTAFGRRERRTGVHITVYYGVLIQQPIVAAAATASAVAPGFTKNARCSACTRLIAKPDWLTPYRTTPCSPLEQPHVRSVSTLSGARFTPSSLDDVGLAVVESPPAPPST